MENPTDTSLSDLTQHGAVLDQLGDREPSTIQEAQAVLEDIRARKGILDDETVYHLNFIPERNRRLIQRNLDALRETEAAYTRRY